MQPVYSIIFLWQSELLICYVLENWVPNFLQHLLPSSEPTAKRLKLRVNLNRFPLLKSHRKNLPSKQKIAKLQSVH